MRPRVTIVTATYKTRISHLTAAIQSALNQTFTDFEVIVTDDSPDQSLKSVVDGFADARIRYRHNAPALGVARNHWAAFREARGEYIVLLNHDDWLAPTFVERMAEILAADSTLTTAFCDHWVIDDEGRPLVEATERASARWGRKGLPRGVHLPSYELLAAQSIPFAVGSMFRRHRLPASLPDDAGPAYDVWLAYLLCRDGSGAYYLPERLSSWRAHAENLTNRGGTDWGYGSAECWHAVFTDARLSTIHDVARRKAAAAYAACAVNSRLAGEKSRCLRFAWRSLAASASVKGVAAAFLPLVPRRLAERLLARVR